jgi:F-type H+-transporting ATPase subunit delta
MANEGRDLGVPRVYAKAMLDLAVAQNQADELLAELTDLGHVIAADPELGVFLGSPLVAGGVRAEALEKIFRRRASDLLADSLEVINAKGRLGLLPQIIDAYRGEFRALRGMVDARVVSAVPLTPALRANLIAAIASFTGKTPDLAERVDPAILGGLVVEVAGEKIDSSLMSRLHDVSSVLAQRAAHELHRGISMVETAAPA